MEVGSAEIVIVSQYLALLRAVNTATSQVLSIRRHQTASCDTLLAGSKRRCLLMTGKDDEMTRSFNVTPKTTEQHLIARSDKSVVYVTKNKDSVRRFVLLKLTTDRHEATRGLFETAELLFSNGVIYAAFNCVGNTPDDSDLFNSLVMNGSSTSVLSLRRCVGSGPVSHSLARSK